MKALYCVVQTCCIGFICVLFWKIDIIVRQFGSKAAIKARERYNKKHHTNYSIDDLTSTGASYQIDEGRGMAIFSVLFLLGLLFSLYISLENDRLFCIISAILIIAISFYCICARSNRTKTYRVFVYIFVVVSFILCVHIIISLILNTKVLIDYANSFNALLYIWFVMLMCKLFIVGKM